MAFFQYRLDEWEKRITADIFSIPGGEDTETRSRRIRTVLNLRANHLRMLVARIFLCHNRPESTPSDTWTSLINIAANTIYLLARLDRSTKEYRFQQAQLNYFLVGALGVLFLAITEDSTRPNPVPSESEHTIPSPTFLKAQKSSMIALNLLCLQAGSSRQCQRLWARVRGVTNRLDLLNRMIPTPNQPVDKRWNNDVLAESVPDNVDDFGAYAMPAESCDPMALGAMAADMENATVSGLDPAWSPSGFDVASDLVTFLHSSLFTPDA
jgi:hypothetical protein